MFNLEEFYSTFHKPYELSTQMDNTFAQIHNEEGLKTAIEYLVSMGATKLDKDNYQVTYAINEYTDENNTQEEKQRIISSLTNLKDYIISAEITYNEKKKKEELVIKTTKGDIRVIMFSSLVSSIKQDLPLITTKERNGKCFDLTYQINRRLGLPHVLVTGFIYGYTDVSRYLHSWIELTYKGEEYVIDGTLNAMINKEGYYLMKHAQAITKVSSETFQQDLEQHLEKLQGLPLEIYLVYRNEIINGLDISKDKLNITPNF